MMRRARSVNPGLYENESLAEMVRPSGDFLRILYLEHASECNVRRTSSSGKFSAVAISP